MRKAIGLAMGLAIGLAFAGAMALADLPPVETAELGEAKVTILTYSFLTEEEIATLRLVLTSKDALSLFVPEPGGFSAMAVSPDDGFIRDGQLIPSATAIAGLGSLDEAQTSARAACDKARKGKADCVVVLEVVPAK